MAVLDEIRVTRRHSRRVIAAVRRKGGSTLTPHDNQNPYLPSHVDVGRPQSTASRFGFGIGLAGFLLVLAPSLYMCFICVSMLWSAATMETPKTSVRPMGLPIAMIGLSIVGALFLPIAMLCSWIARLLGSPNGAMIAKGSVKFVALPFALGVLGFIGLVIICTYRGIAIGD